MLKVKPELAQQGIEERVLDSKHCVNRIVDRKWKEQRKLNKYTVNNTRVDETSIINNLSSAFQTANTQTETAVCPEEIYYKYKDRRVSRRQRR